MLRYTNSQNFYYPGLTVTLLDTNQCSTSNGGCDQNCTDVIPGHECSCSSGYALNSNGQTCSGEYVNINNHFMYTHTSLFQISMSVMITMVGVSTTVSTLMEATPAPVAMDMI